MLKKTLAFTCAGLFIASTALAQGVGDGLEPEPDQSTTRVGTRGANFLELPVGARAQALGGAGVALIGGAEAMYWNVASIAEVESFSVAWSYSELFDEADITHQFAAGVLPLNDVSSLGVSVIALSSGDIIRTNEEFPEGGDPQFGSEFDWTGFAGSIAYARVITDRLSVGGALKIISEGIEGAKANWVGGDLGARFRTGLLGVTIGATLQNIGGESSFDGSAIERVVAASTGALPTEDNVSIALDTDDLALPTAIRFSAVADVTGTPDAWFPASGPQHNLKLVVDFFDAIDTPLESSFGLEYGFRDIVFGRFGKRFLNEERDDFRDFADGLAFGGGLQVPVLGRNLGVDYAYTDMGVLENIQTFTIHFGS